MLKKYRAFSPWGQLGGKLLAWADGEGRAVAALGVRFHIIVIRFSPWALSFGDNVAEHVTGVHTTCRLDQL